MDMDLLDTLRAITDTGSTLGAAEELKVSQSAVSRRLAQLEELLGLQLFIRDKGRLIPTRENRAILPQIRTMLDHQKRLTTRAEELRTGNASSVTLRIAVPASMTLAILPEILAEFLARNDRVQVEVHTGAYDTIERMLTDERAELGFLRAPAQRPGISLMPFISVGTVCVLPKDHPLAARSELSVSDLSGVELILLARMRMPRQEIDRLFWKVGLLPRVRLEVHSVMSACALAARGLGVTLVNELMAQDYRHLPIAIRPLKESLEHPFAFAYSESTPISATAREFVEVATRYISSLIEKQTGRSGG